ncbi:hypothetical protein [Sphaerisporangium perillae]|uniref:hypothetical protein n=1 Tax=Sphaerisporangium perillae TaxID=2935860 RepID=UPI00200E08E3|nr:hypothetical protein [Sphaerisporangium perillae]
MPTASLSEPTREREDVIIEIVLFKNRDGWPKANIQAKGQRVSQLFKPRFQQVICVRQKFFQPDLVWMAGGHPAGIAEQAIRLIKTKTKVSGFRTLKGAQTFVAILGNPLDARHSVT